MGEYSDYKRNNWRSTENNTTNWFFMRWVTGSHDAKHTNQYIPVFVAWYPKQTSVVSDSVWGRLAEAQNVLRGHRTLRVNTGSMRQSEEMLKGVATVHGTICKRMGKTPHRNYWRKNINIEEYDWEKCLTRLLRGKY